MEHILVFEEKTGVSVPANCCIHHLNGIKTDNRIENLCMMSVGAHTALHNTGKKKSEETKKKISQKSKERLSDKRNHPFYKDIDVGEMCAMRNSGATVKSVCNYFGISKRTYYDKMEEYKNGT
jgi:DNA-binding NtrC family response regulator